MAAIVERRRSVETDFGPARSRPGRIAVAVLLTALVVALGATLVLRNSTTVAKPHELLLGVTDLTYSTKTLRVGPGEVTLAFANTDAVPHTFTIDELGVDLETGGGEAARTTFTATPGTYAFHCTIPGHDVPAMRGVLTVTH